MVKKTHLKRDICSAGTHGYSYYISEIVGLSTKLNIKKKAAVSLTYIRDIRREVLWFYKLPLLHQDDL